MNAKIGFISSIVALATLVTLTACQSTSKDAEPPLEYADLLVTEGMLTTAEWQGLQRREARYPIEGAREGKEGCATLEYVITPDYSITDVRIVSTTAAPFAREALSAMQKWSIHAMPVGLINEPIKTQTRFEFCLENHTGRCALAQLNQFSRCSGTDVLPSIGYRVVQTG